MTTPLTVMARMDPSGVGPEWQALFQDHRDTVGTPADLSSSTVVELTCARATLRCTPLRRRADRCQCRHRALRQVQALAPSGFSFECASSMVTTPPPVINGCRYCEAARRTETPTPQPGSERYQRTAYVQLSAPFLRHGAPLSWTVRALASNRFAIAATIPRSKSHGYGFSQTQMMRRSPSTGCVR